MSFSDTSYVVLSLGPSMREEKPLSGVKLQALGYYCPVLRARGFGNLKLGAGALTGVLAFRERQQTVAPCPGKQQQQQHCSVTAEHSKFFSLDPAVTAVWCSKRSPRLTPSLPKVKSIAKA